MQNQQDRHEPSKAWRLPGRALKRLLTAGVRFVQVVLVLALVLCWLAEKALAAPCDNHPPVSATQPVTVPVEIYDAPAGTMFGVCRKQPVAVVIYGCAFQAYADQPARIFLSADLDQKGRACTLAYELAHLPPNNWADPEMESHTPDLAAR